MEKNNVYLDYLLTDLYHHKTFYTKQPLITIGLFSQLTNGSCFLDYYLTLNLIEQAKMMCSLIFTDHRHLNVGAIKFILL